MIGCNVLKWLMCVYKTTLIISHRGRNSLCFALCLYNISSRIVFNNEGAFTNVKISLVSKSPLFNAHSPVCPRHWSRSPLLGPNASNAPWQLSDVMVSLNIRVEYGRVEYDNSAIQRFWETGFCRSAHLAQPAISAISDVLYYRPYHI